MLRNGLRDAQTLYRKRSETVRRAPKRSETVWEDQPRNGLGEARSNVEKDRKHSQRS